MNRLRLPAPLRVILTYLLLVAVWFVLSDLLYFTQPGFPPQLIPVQILRNQVFVVISTAALYGVVRREFRSRAGAEAALQDSEARYRSIIDAMEEGVVFQDTAGHIVTCNANAERVFWAYHAISWLASPRSVRAGRPSTKTARPFPVTIIRP